jgi:hypothetical protein
MAQCVPVKKVDVFTKKVTYTHVNEDPLHKDDDQLIIIAFAQIASTLGIVGTRSVSVGEPPLLFNENIGSMILRHEDDTFTTFKIIGDSNTKFDDSDYPTTTSFKFYISDQESKKRVKSIPVTDVKIIGVIDEIQFELSDTHYFINGFTCLTNHD